MDGSANDQYARAPKVEDLVNLCRLLNQSKVRYILIGGFAMILHGFVRGTKDVDLLVDASEENVLRIKEAMGQLPDNAIALIENTDVATYQVVRVADEIVVDLLANACDISYEQAKADVVLKNVDTIQIPVASKKMLIRMKDTVRPADHMDVAFLKQLIQKEP